ncbi:MAG TPA: hypothetical protein VLB49_16820 [Gemmatimonadales bacterium]|nr:hypothetical protein [Gemmatimonadales bacterium]
MRIELTPTPDPNVPFRFRLGDRMKAPATGKEGRIVGGRYEGPVPAAGVALAYAIEGWRATFFPEGRAHSVTRAGGGRCGSGRRGRRVEAAGLGTLVKAERAA